MTRRQHHQLVLGTAQQAVLPLSWATATGDATGAKADHVRWGVTEVRLEVFVVEQHVPLALEIDARDEEPTTLHILVSGADGVPLGAGRLLQAPGRPQQAHLGRLAVREAVRGTGLGAQLVARIEQEALAWVGRPAPARPGRGACGGCGSSHGLGPRSVTVVLSAQEQAMGFYERCGYTTVDGRRYLDAGIWHRDMARTVTAETDNGCCEHL